MTDKQRYVLLRQAREHLHNTQQGYADWKKKKVGDQWKAAEALLAKLERDLKPPPPIPTLGPVTPGAQSILTFDLTHLTGGLDDYPAFDSVFDAGGAVIAPEFLVVTRQSSARRRDGGPNGKAFYATGKTSKLKYWFGHTDVAPAVGTEFRKGARMCRVTSNHEAPHLHVGIDAKPVIGKRLLYGKNGNGPDYTRGSPTIGAQLAKALT